MNTRTTFLNVKRRIMFGHMFISVMALLISMPAYAAPDYFVDAHSQIDQYVSLGLVAEKMQENNVRLTILSTRGPNAQPWDIAPQTGPDIIDAVRSKSNAYNTDYLGSVDDYIAFFDKQAVEYAGFFNAAAELLIYHAAKSETIPEVIVDIDSPKVTHAIQYSQSRNIPVVIHIEFAALPPELREVYMRKLENKLDEYPGLPFALIHMGQLGVGEVLRLIMRHDNIYFMTSHADPISAETAQPWTNLFKGNTLSPEWRNAFKHFPGRFIFAIDNVFMHHWDTDYGPKMEYWRNAMNSLPDDVANQIAHGNAEALWHLP